MAHWGPGAIPPGYTIAPDGSLVPLQPVGLGPHYPPMGGPGFAPVYGPIHPPAHVHPVAYPPAYLPANPPAHPVPSAMPQPAVSISVTVQAPVMQAPLPPMAYPSLPSQPLGAAMIGPPSNLPLPLPHTAPPVAYAPAWSGVPQPEQPAHSLPSGLSQAPQSGYGQLPTGQGPHELALYSPPGALAESRDSAASQRPPSGAEARYYGAMSLATSGVILATALATVSFFVVPVGAVLASAAVASAITGSMGFWLLRQGKRSKHEINLPPELQVQIMNFATRKEGRVTVTSLAQGLGWTLDEAEHALKELSNSHYVDVELDPDHGVVIYVFRELVQGKKKPPAALPATTATPPEQK